MQILIPVNRLDQAKSRLAVLLTAAERRQLALLTLENVVSAARGVGDVHVLSADLSLASVADNFIAEDPRLRGLNAQLQMAMRQMGKEPQLTILHADLPLATSERLTLFLESAPTAPSVTAVRSADGGTNVMLLSPPAGFPLAYGPKSFDKHVDAATANGMAFNRHRNAELELDLDSPNDVAELFLYSAAKETPVVKYLRTLMLTTRAAWPTDE